MRILHRIAAITAPFFIAASGLLALTSPASAQDLPCDHPRYLTGSGGHHGASIVCYNGSFTGVIDCQKPDGYTYTHFGNRAMSGGTSTTWCDLDAVVTHPRYVQS